MSTVLYFGHPMNIYQINVPESSLESELIAKIQTEFPHAKIINPGLVAHELKCKEYRARGDNPMDYFFNEVLPQCDGGVFLPFRDGKWGTGVFGEAKWFFDRSLPTWLITSSGQITPIDPFSISAQNLVLSVSETRERIRTADGWRAY